MPIEARADRAKGRQQLSLEAPTPKKYDFVILARLSVWCITHKVVFCNGADHGILWLAANVHWGLGMEDMRQSVALQSFVWLLALLILAGCGNRYYTGPVTAHFDGRIIKGTG